MYHDILSYVKSAQDSHPMLSGIGGAVAYVMFPEQAYLTSCFAIVIMMILDVITKYYAISTKNGGFLRSIRNGNISSNCMWAGYPSLSRRKQMKFSNKKG